MKRLYTLLFMIGIFIQTNIAQSSNTANTNSSKMYLSSMFSFSWNLYHWYQQPTNYPFAKVGSGERGKGQILNVLPSIRIGTFFIFEKGAKSIGLTIESGFSYMPFGFDLDERKGHGAWSVPLLSSLILPVGKGKDAKAAALFCRGRCAVFSNRA